MISYIIVRDEKSIWHRRPIQKKLHNTEVLARRHCHGCWLWCVVCAGVPYALCRGLDICGGISSCTGYAILISSWVVCATPVSIFGIEPISTIHLTLYTTTKAYVEFACPQRTDRALSSPSLFCIDGGNASKRRQNETYLIRRSAQYLARY